MISINQVEEIFSSHERIIIVNNFSINEQSVHGKIGVTIDNEGQKLEWDVEISSIYPFKIMGGEPIIFRNIDLLEYPHIMKDGHLCMHPAEFEDPKSQLKHDIALLIEWVDTYYIERRKDSYYEHLVVEDEPIDGEYYTFSFTSTDKEFEKNDYGIVKYATILKGQKRGKPVNNFIVQGFISYYAKNKEPKLSQICKIYLTFESEEGIYFLLEKAPALYNKFIFEDFEELKGLFTQAQKDFIYKFINFNNSVQKRIQLFCGYKLPNGDLHWQVLIFSTDNPPIQGVRFGTGKDRIWHTDFIGGRIHWAETKNISYQYFFGRGSMPQELSEKRIFILGIGAIGSIIAETLTRLGARNITICDIDIKNPENVCRSAYTFFTGITDKVEELKWHLIQISPHVECNVIEPILDIIIKESASNHHDMSSISKLFDNYDFVFDCTTDNQLMRIMDTIKTKAMVVNLSITNYAQDLICGFSPNITQTVLMIYALLDRTSHLDLYQPIGCWNPTFKASYNDISCKVQFGLHHILKMLNKEEPLGSFYITEENKNLTFHRI